MISFVSETQQYAKALGLSRALVVACFTRLLRRVLPPGMSLPLPVPGHSEWVRARSRTSDASVYAEVFFSENYRLDALDTPSFVVDAGANVGYASLRFSLAWPSAKIVAVEPDESNYCQLVRNTRLRPNVDARLAALWGEPVALRISNPNGSKSGLRVEPSSGPAEIPALTVSDLRRLGGTGKIDLFKMDIEGAELNLLTSDPGCLDQVAFLMIELHDRHQPGCSEALERALERRQCETSQHGNMTYVRLQTV